MRYIKQMKYSKSVSSEYNVALHDDDDGEQSAYGRSRRGPSGPHIYGPCPSPCLRGSWAHPCCLLTSSHLGGLNPPPPSPDSHLKALWACWTLIPDLIYPWDPSLSVLTLYQILSLCKDNHLDLLLVSFRTGPWVDVGFQRRILSFFLCVCVFFFLFVFPLTPPMSLSPPSHAHMAQGSSAESAKHLQHYHLRATVGETIMISEEVSGPQGLPFVWQPLWCLSADTESGNVAMLHLICFSNLLNCKDAAHVKQLLLIPPSPNKEGLFISTKTHPLHQPLAYY